MFGREGLAFWLLRALWAGRHRAFAPRARHLRAGVTRTVCAFAAKRCLLRGCRKTWQGRQHRTLPHATFSGPSWDLCLLLCYSPVSPLGRADFFAGWFSVPLALRCLFVCSAFRACTRTHTILALALRHGAARRAGDGMCPRTNNYRDRLTMAVKEE